MHIHKGMARRVFLRRTAQLGLLGSAAPLASALGLVGAAAAQDAPDYKALVCVFLYGGNDYANTLPPFDEGNYGRYFAARPQVAIPREQLQGSVLSPLNDLRGHQYALNPALAPFRALFDQGKLAVVLNVGTLIQPTTKREFLASSVPLPPKVFSHNDQQSFFQSAGEEGASSGWGGRMGDLLMDSNKTSALTCVNTSGNAIFLAGKSARAYVLDPSGIELFLGGETQVGGSSQAATMLYNVIQRSRGGLFDGEYARIAKRALQMNSQVAGALASAPDANFAAFRQRDGLSEQLKMVARMIAVAPLLGMRRQVFFVATGGWDTHDELSTRHPALLGRLARAMRAFYDTTVSMRVADKITTFTASDFGRSLIGNPDGSDHGWGGMHFVMGGAVRGQRIFGVPPTFGIDTNDDVDSGRLIPTTSVDQYAATLGAWFGVGPKNLTYVMPNLANFNASTWNLGFV